MADLKVYESSPLDSYYLHDPLTGTEVFLSPNADRDAVAKAVEQGASIIHQATTGERSLATIDELPEPEEPLQLTVLSPEYVDGRMAIVMAAFGLVEQALEGTMPAEKVGQLHDGLVKLAESLSSDDLETMSQVASDFGGIEGPSIE